jgi:hypothetical protein
MLKVPIVPYVKETTQNLTGSIFWNVMLCSPAEFHSCFGGKYCLHLQGRRESQASNEHTAGDMQGSACCLCQSTYSFIKVYTQWPLQFRTYILLFTVYLMTMSVSGTTQCRVDSEIT